MQILESNSLTHIRPKNRRHLHTPLGWLHQVNFKKGGSVKNFVWYISNYKQDRIIQPTKH